MPSDTIVNLLKYGNWSGPGWSASRLASEFEDAGVARLITPADRLIPGIDPYDNYVAKVHDLNEFAAEDQLRLRLADLGLVDNSHSSLNGMPVYASRLQYGGADKGDSRLASFHHYRDTLNQAGAQSGDEEKLVVAFALYYRHIIKSNAQFAIDQVLNRFNTALPGADQLLMYAQLMGAPHLFLAEATAIAGLLAKRIEVPYGPDIVSTADRAAYMDLYFLTPDGPDMSGAPVAPLVPVLTRNAVIRASLRQLRRVYMELNEAQTEVPLDLMEIIEGNQADGGFDSVDACLAMIVDLDMAAITEGP